MHRILNRKDQARLKDNGDFDLPYWPQWKADREQDIDEVFGWVRTSRLFTLS